ncbi:hypothetical protein AHAS_Ahas13G0222700 [Arachis hypogaea]
MLTSLLLSINLLMMLGNERPIILRDTLINKQAARNAIIDMAGVLAAIAEMKRRFASQLPITDDVAVSVPPPFRHVLDKELQAPEFVDKHFMDEDTREILAKMLLGYILPRVQRMLPRSVTYVWDVEVEITSLRSELLAKDKMIAEAATKVQDLNSSVTALKASKLPWMMT